MKCPIDHDTLSRLADGLLPEDLAASVREHLKTCPDCRKKLERIEGINRILSAMEEDVPVEVDASFYKRLEELEPEPVIAPAWKRILDEVLTPMPVLAKAAAAALLLAVITYAGFFYTQPGLPLVTGMQGAVLVSRAGTDTWSALSEGALLNKGDRIRTEVLSTCDISLAKKYSFRVKGGSEVKIAKLSPKRGWGAFSADLEKGGVLVDIDKAYGPSKFQVDTDLAEVRARGTKFMVSLGGVTDTTWVGVLEGKVDLKSLQDLPQYSEAPREVEVQAGMKAEVIPNKVLQEPVPLLDDEWSQLSELYMIGKKTRVALFISTDKNRVLELLSPCDVYITDEKPRTIPDELIDAVRVMQKAVRVGDETLHARAMEKLEDVIKQDPEASYNLQLRLFMGAYYYYAGMYQKAIDAFSLVKKEHPRSQLVSLSECAKAVIYEDSLKDHDKAREIYMGITIKYPRSPEAEFARARLKALAPK